MTANATAMRTRLYSKPPSVTHGPLLPWTVMIAVTITAMISAAASGVSRPSASRMPPASSARAGRDGVAPAGLQAERLEEAAGALDAVAAEPAEQLLGAVARHQQAHDDAQDEQTDFHVNVPPSFRVLAQGRTPAASAYLVGGLTRHEPGVTKLLQTPRVRYLGGAVPPAQYAGSLSPLTSRVLCRAETPLPCPISNLPSQSMTRPRRTATSPVVAGSLLVATIVLCAGVGFGLGALVGWPVPLGIAGLFAGFGVGLALVIDRFR